MRILIVEDEAKLAEALKKGLELKGFAVDWLADSEKARTRILLYRTNTTSSCSTSCFRGWTAAPSARMHAPRA
jgi:hypothetical protein